jgi:iron(III) transport system substrate-binding protein
LIPEYVVEYVARVLLGALALVLAGCSAASPAPASPRAPAPAPATAPSAPTAAQAAPYDTPLWRELAEAARKEGRLILASGPSPETRLRLPAAFKERFGVEIEYLGGRSSDLANRLQNERAAGLYTIDAIIGGGDTIIRMYQEGWFDPIRPLLVAPEVTDPSVWRGNRLPFLDPEERFLLELEGSVTGVVAVNTQVVREGEIRSLDDLLDPKWRGKISVEDPTTAGSGQNRAVYLYVLKGEEYFKRLYVDQQPAMSRDTRQIGDWLARGTYPITLGLNVNDIEPMERDGLPVKLLGTLDGPGYVTGGFSVLGIFNNAPHPNAAKLFANWITSPEGQRVHAEAENQAPLRKDVPHPWVREHQVPKEGINYLRLYDYHYVTEQKPAILRRFREILGQ